MTVRVPYIPTTVTIAGYDTRALGLVVDAVPNVRDVVTLEDLTVPVASLPGVSLADATPRVSPRRFTIGGVMFAADAATLRANYRTLHYKAAGGSRILTLVDDTSRQITARLAGATFTYQGLALGSEQARVELTWQAIDPYWADTSDTTVNLSTSPAACALGTVPSLAVVTITGAATTPTLTYKNSAGTTVYTLTLTTIAGGANVIINMETRTLTHSGTGVTPSLRTAGRFFALSPYDGDYATAAWPTLTISAGTGTAVYRKRYHG